MKHLVMAVDAENHTWFALKPDAGKSITTWAGDSTFAHDFGLRDNALAAAQAYVRKFPRCQFGMVGVTN